MILNLNINDKEGKGNEKDKEGKGKEKGEDLVNRI